METKKIEALLGKYYEGETSLEEEKVLKNFFKKGNVPAHLQEEVAMFTYFDWSQQEVMSEEIGVEQLMPEMLTEAPKPKVSRMYKVMRWAAVLVGFMVMVGVGYVNFSTGIDEPIAANELVIDGIAYGDSEQAYQKAKEALLLVSSKMNKGTSHLQHLNKISEPMTLVSRN